MSSEQSFLLALLLLILGSGCLKGNISAQVGTLYPPEAESMRARGFTIFSTGINIGSVAGPLAAGGVAAVYGWHAGFALAAGLMLVALAIYLLGQRHLPHASPRAADAALPAMSAEERRRTYALIGMIALSVLPMTAYSMIWNVGIVWVDERVSLASPFGAVPASWFNSVDAFASILVAAPLLALWAWQARRRTEPASLAKIGIGAAITGVSALFFVAGCLMPDGGGKVPVIWALLGFTGMGAGFMWYWPVTLALVSQAAPAQIRSTLMGGAFLSPFVALTLMGWVGSYYGQMGNAAFWTLDAAIGMAGALLAFAVRKPLSAILHAG